MFPKLGTCAFASLQGSSNGGYFAAQGDDPRRNVLSLGCRVAGPRATSELLSVQGVACTFPNTTVNVIRSPPWELLLSRIGDDLMFALLRQHAVLQRLPNRCYMQASASLGSRYSSHDRCQQTEAHAYGYIALKHSRSIVTSL